VTGILLTCAPANWVRLTHAWAARKPVTFWTGDKDAAGPPSDGMVYIAAFGRLRFRAPMTPRRTEHLRADDAGWPAGGRVLSVRGWHVEFDLARAEGVTIDREIAWWPRWRNVDWRGPPGPPRKNEAPTVPAQDEEREWAGWMFERMPAEIAHKAARAQVALAAAPVVPAVVVSGKGGKKAPPVGATRGLFDGLI
jgi:hypothetical protein